MAQIAAGRKTVGNNLLAEIGTKRKYPGEVPGEEDEFGRIHLDEAI
jgi:hypothetical protein